MNETRILSEYGANAQFRDLPDDVVSQIKQLIADQIACQISAAELPWSRATRSAALRLSGVGPSTVVVHGDRLAVDEAAFVNGAFGHGNEIDDADLTVRTHPGSVVIPAAIAASELVPTIDGALLLTAISAGCEVMLRIADASMPALMDIRHHNTPSSAGPFGSATAVSRVLGLSPTLTEHALSIAGYHSAGLMQYTVGGGSVKRIQTGIGSKSGVRAAFLAAEGVTGPAEILEGSRGFLAAFAGDYACVKLIDGLGSKYLSLGTCLKRFNVKYRLHAAIDGLIALRDRYQFSFEEIAGLRVGVSEATRQLVGLNAVPTDVVEVQLSMRFALAAVAKYGPAVLGNVDPALFRDNEILDLAQRVEVYREPTQEQKTWMNWGCVLTVTLGDATIHELHVPAPRGSPDNPMSDVDLAEKFHRLVDPVLGEHRSTAILEVIADLESASPQRDLVPLLVR